MTRAYARIAFTPDVLAAQSRWGTSAQAGPALRPDIDPHDALTPAAMAFASEVNTAFIATVNSSGWPYVQHRGGPRGFIHVLDSTHLLMPDFDGNGQMLTVGNLHSEDRVMLILMDYAQQRRLKIWGHARFLEGDERRTVADWGDAARGLLVEVCAMNFNCPAYIPPLTDEAFLP